MMNKLIFVLLFSITFSYAQKKDLIFRIEGPNYGAVYSYGVSVLKLSEDHHYQLINQKFWTKKLARKNVLHNYTEERGIWSMSNDTLKLAAHENRREMLFIKKKNNLIYLIDNIDPSRYRWKKVKN